MKKALVAALVAGLVAVVGVTAGLLAFEPWRAFTDSTVEETLPVADVVAPARAPAPSPSPFPGTAASPATAAAPRRLRSRSRSPGVASSTPSTAPTGSPGSSSSPTVGASSTSRGSTPPTGPDLFVLLSSAPSGGSWGSYDDGHHVSLGALKANHGTHHYEIPADADLTDIASVVIWCDRFDVAFGTAPVDPA